MGQVARELGFQGSFYSLLEPIVGLEWGCKKLSRCYERYGANDDGIAAYNAGSPRKENGKYVNQEYVDKVLGLLKRIRETHSG
jgi:hypothetical protein